MIHFHHPDLCAMCDLFILNFQKCHAVLKIPYPNFHNMRSVDV